MFEMDWAQKLIAEIVDAADAAITLFRSSYAQGDSVGAWERYSAGAVREVWRGSYVELTFPDGSRYRDSNQGIDRFYPPHFDDEPAWQ